MSGTNDECMQWCLRKACSGHCRTRRCIADGWLYNEAHGLDDATTALAGNMAGFGHTQIVCRL